MRRIATRWPVRLPDWKRPAILKEVWYHDGREMILPHLVAGRALSARYSGACHGTVPLAVHERVA